jgi:glucosamine-6-phosphate deaminase
VSELFLYSGQQLTIHRGTVAPSRRIITQTKKLGHSPPRFPNNTPKRIGVHPVERATCREFFAETSSELLAPQHKQDAGGTDWLVGLMPDGSIILMGASRVILKVFEDKASLSRAAAEKAAAAIRRAIAQRQPARIVVATGTSQIGFLEELTKAEEIAWGRVEMFHLDEYVGLPITHPASFRKYLLERLIEKVGITQYHLLNGMEDAGEVARRVGEAISAAPVDVAFVGIGENGHLAFNDPPADFKTEEPYLVVRLDEACRRQQVGEGWFGDISEVPRQAISMSVRQILKAKEIVCIVPDARKAVAVKTCFEGEISPMAPASILRTHPDTTIYLDRDSSGLLSGATLRSLSAPHNR